MTEQHEMFNHYTEEGTLNDCHNDLNIVQDLATEIDEVRKKAIKWKQMGALAYNEDTIDKVIAQSNTLIDKLLKPHEALIRLGLEKHEGSDE